MNMSQRDGSSERLSRQSGHTRGSNLLGVSQYNERLILQLIRRAGSLPKAEIARMTELSAQTVSVIINRLIGSKLLRKQPRQRAKGKVGQPAVPIALNPAGAYSIGVKIGRRSLDVLMVDFSGSVLRRFSHHYDYPDPDDIFPKIDQDISTLINTINTTQQDRIVGIGIAAPYALGGWQQEIGAPKQVLERWNDIDIGQRVSVSQGLPVWFSNDATAACIAELAFDKGTRFNNFLYFFIGTFIGGGVVLNGTLYAGESDNAGAVGTMPVPAAYGGKKSNADALTVQLLHCASRYLLDNQLEASGIDPNTALEYLAQGQLEAIPAIAVEIFDTWLQQAAVAIAFAITAAISVIDFEGIVIDGAFPANLMQRLSTAVDKNLSKMNLEGLVRPQIIAGTIGNDARALGGAIIPFYSNFAPDREVLLKLGLQESK